MDVLLTFTGFHDPYSKGLIGDEEQPGPILSLVRVKPFDRIVLFSTPNTEKNTDATQEALKGKFTQTEVEVRNLRLEDPTDYLAILRELRLQIQALCEYFTEARFFVAVASGTPQMHACWLLLVAGGELPARILHVRPPRFVTRELPAVSEVDLTAPEFPVVRTSVCWLDLPEVSPPDLETALLQTGIIGDHPSLRKALEKGAAFAAYQKPILIMGETGTGKELFARLIHRLSGRPLDQFVPENCATIKDLAESRLFGHRKGAFTGAVSDRKGLFDQADGGTLFLDELGELPLETQAKFLRVLQDGRIEPVGGQEAHQVDVRIIAATNKDLPQAVKAGEFREDLYYRLRGCEIRLPALRDRKTDIPKIALHVLDRINASLKRPKRLSPDTLKRLQHHPWPGNVRDLEHVIENAAILSRRDILEPEDFELPDLNDTSINKPHVPEPYEGFSLEEYIKQVRTDLITKAGEMAGGNQTRAAKLLGLTPQAIHKFFKARADLNRS